MAQQDEDAVEAQDCTAAVELEPEETGKELAHLVGPSTVPFDVILSHSVAYVIWWAYFFVFGMVGSMLAEWLLGLTPLSYKSPLDFKLSSAGILASALALLVLVVRLVALKKPEVPAGQVTDLFAKVLALSAVFLTSWAVLFAVSIGTMELREWLTGATTPLGYILSTASIIATIFAVVFVSITLFMASKKPESSDATGSDS
jgi:hypothetical protein